MIGDMEDYGVVPGHEVPPTPPPSQLRRPRTEPFLRGPIPMAWLARAAGLSKPALPAGLGLWFMRGVSKTSGPIRVSNAVRRKVGLSARQMLRGLHALEKGGLVQFVKGGRGRCPVVQVLGIRSEVRRHQLSSFVDVVEGSGAVGDVGPDCVEKGPCDSFSEVAKVVPSEQKKG